MTHFHIRFEGASAMSWERFQTREEAEANARQRTHSSEGYTIEELGEGCTRCQAGNTDAPPTEPPHR